MKSLVVSSELFNDQKRRVKLNALIRAKSNIYQSPKIEIFNTTDVELPEEIQKIIRIRSKSPHRGFFS